MTLEDAIVERGDINDFLTTALWQEERIVVLRILHSYGDGFIIVFATTIVKAATISGCSWIY